MTDAEPHPSRRPQPPNADARLCTESPDVAHRLKDNLIATILLRVFRWAELVVFGGLANVSAPDCCALECTAVHTEVMR